jgi:pimeloyl-ACP methyl ester carboxylesterase
MSVHELESGLTVEARPAREQSLAGAAERTLPSSNAGLLRAGAGSPLLLLHGVTGSARMWERVIPLLAPHHEVLAPTALGHFGGPIAERGPVRIRDVVDDAERCLDRLGFERAHLAGNSMGGWVALELARRGRARSVCALSPAGAWEAEDRSKASRKLLLARNRSRDSMFLLPLLTRSALFRRWALRDSALHGDQVSRAELLGLVSDMLGCAAADDLLQTHEALSPLAPDCPVTLAWSGEDRIFPVEINGAKARALVPSARFMVLPNVGHVPMLDDPQLVARTILESCRDEARS